MKLADVPTEDLHAEIRRRAGEVCPRCIRLNPAKEPGRHHPACTANPAYRAGDWN